MSVRTRVAPSPTGDPHVGTAYVALFNLVFARSQGGRFILRIEDTDRQRSSSASEGTIIEALRWVGMDWDEGPDVGGDRGPYRQSERLALYRRHADELVASGGAFRCFCSKERLDDLRRRQQANRETPRYDGHCRDLDPDESRDRASSGETHVVRLDVPATGACRFSDGIRGDIEIPWQQVDMQILVKSDGFPTYHLAAVVDDHLMGITHILRGEEWLSSMPKHRLIYDRFGWSVPAHYHLPLLRNADGSKVSKRRNPTGLNYYRRMGYLPEALCNYLALMGWSMPDEREIFSTEEMTAAFDIDRLTTGGPVFDLAKLDWLNGQYIRSLAPQEFMDRIAGWAVNRDNLAPLAPIVQQRTERLVDLLPQVDYLLGDRTALDDADFAALRLGADDCLRVLDHVGRRLEAQDPWDRDSLQTAIRSLADAMGIPMRDFLAPLFVAMAGRTVALPLFDSMAYLGRDMVRSRLASALAALGSVSKKQAKRLERAYAGLDIDAT
ncbi:MAG: glutamate--tRNA ligase [Gammaproteobacteria bacterium]|nr:glutamate--tRNA ligase [Gammaproteobacteria bacterium]